jgi:hypothetical protein
MKKNKTKIAIIFIMITAAVILCGCGKKYDDYPNLWTTEDGAGISMMSTLSGKSRRPSVTINYI